MTRFRSCLAVLCFRRSAIVVTGVLKKRIAYERADVDSVTEVAST